MSNAMMIAKKYWWIIILIIILPTMVNLILVTPSPCSLTIAGNNVDWLSFWGCYLGAIISTGSAFIILAVQYKQNHIENSKNRELQKNVLLYQQEREQLHSITKISSKLLTSVEPNEVIRTCHKIGFIETCLIIKTFNETISKIEDNINELSLYIDTDSKVKNKRIVVKISSFIFDYILTLKDIENLITIFNNYINDIKIDDLCDTGAFGAFFSKELQSIISEYNQTNPNKKYLSWIDCRSIAIKRIEQIIDIQSDIKREITEYIKSEKERINHILIE